MAHTGAISSDAVLGDLVGSLTDAVEQVRRVLATMSPCNKDHGNAHVRIGVTGQGKAPYHKVFYLAPDGSEKLYGTFYGERRDESFQAEQGAWSSRSSSYEEIRTLIGVVRESGKQRRSPNPDRT